MKSKGGEKPVAPIFFLAKPDGYEGRKAAPAENNLTIELYTAGVRKGQKVSRPIGTVTAVAGEDGYVTFNVVLENGPDRQKVSMTFDTNKEIA